VSESVGATHSAPVTPVPGSAGEALAEALVKPRMRGWIHTWAVGVAAIAAVVLVATAATISATAGWSTKA
jgi:hemolysin III